MVKEPNGKKFTPILVSMFFYRLKERLIGYLELEIITLSRIDQDRIKDYLLKQ